MLVESVGEETNMCCHLSSAGLVLPMGNKCGMKKVVGSTRLVSQMLSLNNTSLGTIFTSLLCGPWKSNEVHSCEKKVNECLI